MNIIYHSFDGALRVATVLLICASVQAQNLYVVNAGSYPNFSGNITEITPGGVQTTIASGLNYPSGLAFNNAGDLFVANGTASPNAYANTITEITPSGAQSTFATFVFNPRGLAFNSAGDLFVSGGLNRNITEITPDGTQSTIASGLGYYLWAMAFDSSGDLFLADQWGSTIYEISPGGVQSIFSYNKNDPMGLAFNGAGDLFVSDMFGNIYEITPGGVQTSFASGLFEPTGLVFNSAGDLFVADQGSGNIYEFTPDGVRSTFASGLDQPVALAFEPSPELVATATNGIIQVAVTMPSPYLSTIVQVSTDMTDWTSVCTNIPPFTFTNSIDTTSPCRFYRALLGP